MPTYDYQAEDGTVVERQASVAERDSLPGLRRVEVPRRLRIGVGATDEQGPDKAIPRALRQLEETVPAERIARDSGFPVSKLKRIWNI
jgi:hypothetical protein